MINLSDENFIAAGKTRLVFQHPENEKKCIKIMQNDIDDLNHREYKYYQHLMKRHADMGHLPLCHGFVSTNLGLGLTFDKVGNEKTFFDQITTGELSKNQAIRLFYALVQYLEKTGICFIDTNLKNLVFHHGKLFIIDGIVPPKRQHSWLYQRIKPLGRWRTKKSLKPAWKKLVIFFD